jgi:DNA invertase Pin-like site-specific DNA recombinase
MAILGYARVSTADQNLDLQIDALKKAGCEKIFKDVVSGVKTQKPEFEKMLGYARKDDTIIVYRLDRLGRNLKGLIELLENLNDMGINIKSISESIDTSTPLGNMFFQVIGMFAELERNIIIERTQAGLSAARARGRKGGKPPGLSEKFKLIAPDVAEMYNKQEKSTTEIRKIFRIKAQATLYKILEYAGVKVKGNLRSRK